MCLGASRKVVKAAFEPLTRAMANWEEEIFAYATIELQALIRSLNSLIRVINRLGRGYSFEVLRADTLYRGASKVTQTHVSKVSG